MVLQYSQIDTQHPNDLEIFTVIVVVYLNVDITTKIFIEFTHCYPMYAITSKYRPYDVLVIFRTTVTMNGYTVLRVMNYGPFCRPLRSICQICQTTVKIYYLKIFLLLYVDLFSDLPLHSFTMDT